MQVEKLLQLLPKLMFLLLMLFAGIRLVAQPSVIGHPQDVSICVNASASFNIVAVNTAAYQWQENDGVGWYNINASISYAQGFNTPTLIIVDANIGLNGYKYRCVVFDAENNQAVSNPATLGVYDPPIITTQPHNTRVCKNEIAQFSVESIYGNIYQWQENIGTGWVNLDDNAFYSGSKTQILNIFTTTGMNGFNYRCLVTNVSCPEISAAATLFVDPTPIIFDVIGGGSYCSGGSGVGIGLNLSETGISYVLFRNGVNTGQVISGNNQAISFGTFTQTGTYTILAINGFTSCEVPMNGQAVVTVNPLPLQQVFAGGGSYCNGNNPPELYLQGSQTGIEYTLYRNGLPTGLTLVGTGFALSFGSFADVGTYTVIATNTQTTCAVQLQNTLAITQNPLPIAFAGNNQSIISGSSANLSGQAHAGSGSYLYSWQPASMVMQPGSQQTNTIPLYQSRLFSMRVTDLQTGCQSLPDSLIIQVSDGPLSVQVSASHTSICPGTGVNLLGIPGGGTGNYSYSWSSIPTGFNANTSEVFVQPTQSSIYILALSDGLETVYDTVGIQVQAVPVAFQLSGGGSFCDGTKGVAVSLSGSEPGVLYTLYHNGNQVAEKEGNGQALSFGEFILVGSFEAKARFIGSSCIKNMNGQVVIQSNPKPVANAGLNQTTAAGGQVTLNGIAAGGSGTYNYSWTPVDKLLNPGSQNPGTMPLGSTQLFTLIVNDQQTGCASLAAQTVVFVNGGELSMTLAADQYSICKGEQVQLLALPSGGSGNYTYLWQSQPPGFVSAIHNPKVSPQQSTVYKLTITDGFQTRTDSISIEVRQSPLAYNMSGGGSFCEGSQGKEIKLSGSQPNVVYQLFRNGTITGNQQLGNGDELSFGYQTHTGTYTAMAINSQSQCEANMSGSAGLQAFSVPVVSAGPDRTIQSGQTTNLNGQVSGGSGNYLINWQPQSLVVNPSALQTLSQPLFSTSMFTLGATDNQSGCQGQRDTVMVYVSGGPLHVIASANQQNICKGATITLLGIASGGTGNYQFQWTSIPPGFYANQQSTLVSPQQNIKYVLTVSDGLHIQRDTLQVSVSEAPQRFAITGGGTLCNTGQSANIGLSGSQQGVTYYLYRNGNEIAVVNGTAAPIGFGLFNQPGTYTVNASEQGSGCIAHMIGEAVITIAGNPIAHAGPDRVISEGGQITISASVTGGSGSYSFNWSPANKLINPDALQPTTAQLFETNVLRLDVLDGLTGCPAAPDYMAIFVGGDNFTVETFASNDLICPGESIQLFALPTGGSGNYSYLWLSEPPGFSAQTYDPVVQPEVSTMYKVLVNDGNTIVQDSVFVSVEAGITAFQLSDGGIACLGGEGVELTLSGSENGINYQLYRNGLFSGISKSGNGFRLDFGSVSQSGTYTVMATNQQSGCSLPMTGEATVTLVDSPQAFAGPHQTIQMGETIQLNGIASGGSGSYAYNWSPSYLLNNPFISNPSTVSMEQSTLFLFAVSDTESGCLGMTGSTLVLVVGGPLGLQLIASEMQVCVGEKVNLLALPEGGTGNYEVNWKNAQGTILYQGTNWSTNIWQTTTFYVALSDQGGQQLLDSITILAGPIPQTYQITGGGSICDTGAGLQIGLNGSENGILYDLYFDHNHLLATQQGLGTALSFGYFGQQGVYTVKARRPGYGCDQLMDGSALIQLIAPPLANAGPDQTIMQGAAAQLSGSAQQGSVNYLFEWQPSNFVANPNAQNTSTVPLFQSTMFTIKVTDAQTQCHSSDQVIIYLQGGALNNTILASSQNVCPGQAVDLTALPGGGTGNYTYTWKDENMQFISSNRHIRVYPSTSSKYYLNLNDGQNSLLDSITINTFAVPQQFTLSGGGSYCTGSSPADILLGTSQTGVTYALMRNGNFTGHSLTGTGGQLNFGKHYAQGNYTVIATNQNGCNRIMQNLVTVNQELPPTAFWVLGGGSFCADEAFGIYLSGSEKRINYTLFANMEPTGITKQGTGAPISFEKPLSSGIYTIVAAKAGTECENSMNGAAPLLALPVPTALITGPQGLCAGESIILTASGGDTYTWNTEPPLNSQSIEVSPDHDEVYTVLATNSVGCSASASRQVMVFPQPEFVLTDNESSQTLTVTATGIFTYAFYNNETLLQTGLSNTYYYGNTQLFDNNRIVVVVTNESDCYEEDWITAAQTIYVNAFSPNGDGINDRFMEGHFIRVFSRWGKEIFVGDKGWDGTYNGSLVAPGTYYFIHEIKNFDGSLLQVRKGSVTLVIE